MNADVPWSSDWIQLKTIPIRVAFNNLKGHDGHLLTQKGNVESERRNKMYTKQHGKVQFILTGK